jgi:hypothetical protein
MQAVAEIDLKQPSEDVRLVFPRKEDGPIIDPEFAALIPPPSKAESDGLEALLLSEGCRDALVVWQGHNILLDGHTRMLLCLKHGLPYRVEEKFFPDRETAKDWIRASQLGKRNASSDGAAYVRGAEYNLQKQPRGGDRRSKDHSKTLIESKDHSETLTTAERLGAKYDLSANTIKRDGDYAAAVDQLVKVHGQDVKGLLLSRGARPSRRRNEELATLDLARQLEVIEVLRETGTFPRPLVRREQARWTFNVPAEAMALARAVVVRLKELTPVFQEALATCLREKEGEGQADEPAAWP